MEDRSSSEGTGVSCRCHGDARSVVIRVIRRRRGPAAAGPSTLPAGLELFPARILVPVRVLDEGSPAGTLKVHRVQVGDAKPELRGTLEATLNKVFKGLADIRQEFRLGSG